MGYLLARWDRWTALEPHLRAWIVLDVVGLAIVVGLGIWWKEAE